jgi:hypothetical protein
MATTTIQAQASIRTGSLRIKVGDSFAALVDIGAIRKPKFASLAKNQEIAFDNVDSLKRFVDGDKAQIEFELCEINLTNLAVFDAGLITLTPVAGSATPVTGEAHGTGWTQGTPIRLTNKNGANTIVSSIVVKAAGSALVLNTDYRTYVGDGTNGELGYTYVVPVTSQSGAITVDYSYTPNASKKLTFSASGAKTLKCVRIENIDATGKVFRIDIEDATNTNAVSIDFPGDDEENVAVLPLKLEGSIVEVIDEQNPT